MFKRLRGKGNGDEGADNETNHNRPQDVVHIKDDKSIVSTISNPEFPDEQSSMDIPEAIEETTEDVVILSPRVKKKVKKKPVVRKSKKATEDNDVDDETPLNTTTNTTTAESSQTTNMNNVSNQLTSPKASKVKVIKKVKPTTNMNGDDVDDQSVKSNNTGNAKKKTTSLSAHLKRGSSSGNIDVDDRSTKSGRSTRSGMKKKKSKKSLCSSSLHSKGGKEEEERSIRSGSKKPKKLSKMNDDADDDSSIRSRSTRSEKKKKNDIVNGVVEGSTTSKDRSVDQIALGIDGTNTVDALREENEALMVETAILRRQLNEAGIANGKSDENAMSQIKISQLQMDLDMAESEINELKQEIQEYDESMMEKDSLIKKLTDAVDAQLDKVEYLELKLHRAEEEFCNMEDEMKEMEDLIEIMRNESKSGTDGRTAPTSSELRVIEEKERLLFEKEAAIQEKEIFLKGEKERIRLREIQLMEEQQELDSERRLCEERKKIVAKFSSDNENDDQYVPTTVPIGVGDELRDKIKELETEHARLLEENERFNKYCLERQAKEQELQEQRDAEIKSIQIGINKQMAELDSENEKLRQEIEDLKEQKESSDEAFRETIEDLRKQYTRLELASQRPDNEGGALGNEYTCELEAEIADLREKIVEQEEHSRRQKEEIALVFVENEELKQDLQERGVEIRNLEAKFSETKEANLKKMKQKDETISFMQTEMMRIMQEKQQTDKLLREKKVETAQSQVLLTPQQNPGVDEEVEKAKLQAINDQLRQLDEENRILEEKMKEIQYNNSIRLKEKQGIILDLQEELNDAKWELGARKEGADYITLLKDRKERKTELDKTRKMLKTAEEKIADLERENAEITSSKTDLEKEVETLNKSVISMDSGEYVSGLKRQIKSLKQHNMALERKLQVEAKDLQEQLRSRDTKIRILEHDIEKLKNPTRAALKGVFYSFGRKGTDEMSLDGDGHAVESTEEKTNEYSTSVTSKDEAQEDATQETKQTAGGNLWNIFSPKRGGPKRMASGGGLRLSWDSRKSLFNDSPSDPAQNKESTKREATIDEITIDENPIQNQQQHESLKENETKNDDIAVAAIEEQSCTKTVNSSNDADASSNSVQETQDPVADTEKVTDEESEKLHHSSDTVSGAKVEGTSIQPEDDANNDLNGTSGEEADESTGDDEDDYYDEPNNDTEEEEASKRLVRV
jgi:hypothetical protein